MKNMKGIIEPFAAALLIAASLLAHPIVVQDTYDSGKPAGGVTNVHDSAGNPVKSAQ